MSTASGFGATHTCLLRALAVLFIGLASASSAWANCPASLANQGTAPLAVYVPEIRFSLHAKIPRKIQIVDDVLEAIEAIWQAKEGDDRFEVDIAVQHLDFLFKIYRPVLDTLGISLDADLYARLQMTRRLLAEQKLLQDFVIHYQRGLIRIPSLYANRRTFVGGLAWRLGRFNAERDAESAVNLPFGWTYNFEHPQARRQVVRVLAHSIDNERLPPVFRRFLAEFRESAGALAMESGALNLIPFLNELNRLP